MNGMASAADEALGNVSTVLQYRNMWPSTLFVYISDKHVAL